ncbi:hypothetical protein D9M69_332490 [compost metagenome]
MADQLDQVVDLHHRAVEGLAQLAQLVAAFGAETDGHVAGGDLVHHLAQALQGGAGGDVETGVEVENGDEHHQQRYHQQYGLHALAGQPAFQLDLEEGQGAVVELVGLVQGGADLVVELRPGRVEGIGHDDLLLEERGALLDGVAAGDGQGVQSLVGARAAVQGVGDLQAVFGVEFIQVQQQVVQLGAGRRIEEALPQGVGADGASLAQGHGDLRRGGGDQFGDLADVGLVVLAEACLDGDELDEDLGIAQQLLDHRALALQRGFTLGGLQGREQLIALGIEGFHLLGFGRDRRQALHCGEQFLLQGGDALFQIARLARLADHRVDQHQIVEAFQAATQAKAGAQQVEALQFGAGADVLSIGIAHQVEVGDQHRQEKQNTDQTELHAEAEAVHQRDGRIQQSLHETSPVLIYCYGRALNPWQPGWPLPCSIPTLLGGRLALSDFSVIQVRYFGRAHLCTRYRQEFL